MKKFFSAAILALTIVGCSKVDPNGLLIAPSHTKDRYEQSKYYFESNKPEQSATAPGEYMLFVDYKENKYKFLIGADFHFKGDTTRLCTFLDKMRTKEADGSNKYIFATILGDIAETQPGYYDKASRLIERAISDTVSLEDTIVTYKAFPLYGIVGNHDITHNGWAYFADLFGASTFTVWVVGYNFDTDDYEWIDCHAFTDSANGTLGEGQLKEFLPEEIADLRPVFRNVFFYTHNPFFRHRYDAIASNFPRDELYWLMNFFAKNEVNYVFSGHIHVHGEDSFRDVNYVTLNAFSKENTPKHAELCEVEVVGEGNSNVKLTWHYFDD